MASISNNEKGASFLVGIDVYDDPTLKNFRKASSQEGVRRLKQLLEQPASQYWPPQKKFELTSRVEYEELEANLSDFLSIEDYANVLIYLSGHGYQCWNEKLNDYKGGYEGYFATSNSLISEPVFRDNQDRLIDERSGLAFDKIAHFIRRAGYLKSLVLLIDACHSGNAIKAEALESALYDRRRASRDKADADRFRYCIIPSSLGVEESWTEDGIGVFTKNLTDILADHSNGPITTERLKAKIKETFVSRHQQIIKPDSGGDAILLFDYALTGKTVSTQKPPILKNGEPCNPYQGLEAFDADSVAFFFGRGAIIEDIINRFSETNFAPVIGASGSGKSSVVKAGVFPTLGKDKQWILLDMTPGGNPLGALASTIETCLKKKLNSSQIPAGLDSFVRRPSRERFEHLLEQLEALPEGRKFLLLIDQFEEIFTLANRVEDSSERKEVLQDQQTFLSIVTAADGRFHVVITMRADFLEACLHEPDLLEQIQSYAIYMPPLRGQALRDAIRKPAERQGGKVEDELVDQLERDVANEPGALPLLEFALTKLWETQQDEDEIVLTLEAYNALGEDSGNLSNSLASAGWSGATSGLKGALNRYANDIFESKDELQQSWMRRLFLQLIRPGEGARDTRQRQPKASLLAIAGDDPKTHSTERKQFEQLLQALVDARLLVTGPAEQSRSREELETLSGEERQRWAEDNQVIDLAHEALIDGWSLYQKWRNEGKDLLRLRAQVEDQRKLWEEQNRSDLHLMTRGLVARVTEVWPQLQPMLRGETKAADEEFYQHSRDYWRQLDAKERRRVEELQLQVDAAQIERKIAARKAPSEILTAAVRMLGRNRELFPNRLIGNVPASLRQVVETIFPSSAFSKHSADVWSVAFSPDGQTIVSGSEDQTVRLWSLDGAPIGAPFQGHSSDVTSVAFSPDGQTIVSGSWDHMVRLWSLDGAPIGAPFQGHSRQVTSVAFSPDGQMIVSGSEDRTVRLWSLDGSPIGSPFLGHSDFVNSVAFSPDGQTIVSGSRDHTVRLWSLDGIPMGKSFLGHLDCVNLVAFSPDGQTIISGSRDHTVRLWSLDGAPIGRPFEGHSQPVTSVAFSPDGQTIVSGSRDHTVRLWNLDGSPMGKPFEGHSGYVNSVAFSPDGQMIVSGSGSDPFSIDDKDHTVRLWSLDGVPIGKPFEGHSTAVNSVAFSPDGQMIVSCSGSGSDHFKLISI